MMNEVRRVNEAKALALLKSGDQEALEWFIDKYSAYVGTVVSNFLRSSMSHEDIEEVARTTSLVVLVHLTKRAFKSSFTPILPPKPSFLINKCY